ncbi:MAG TPA: FliM/FliN family flagellar motor switch protein [Aquificae bacterium]|nr:FliM/FliN family flagellar motor switch protein [Aquificota bacterium]
MALLPYMENNNSDNENQKNNKINKENFKFPQNNQIKESDSKNSYQRVKLEENNLTWKEIESLEKELNFLKDVKLRFIVELDRKKMSFEEIYNLKPGEIITLNRKIDDYIPIFLKNIIFGVGELVCINDKFGVRLIDIRVERFLKDIPGKD